MKYTKTKNIWTPGVDFHALQTGQWVSAGEPLPDRSNCGRFYGVKPGGHGGCGVERQLVAAWLEGLPTVYVQLRQGEVT